MAGTRGPIPKADDERRRRNAPVIDTATFDISALDPRVVDAVVVPEPDEKWHRIATMLWESLEKSGQSSLYEPSDWMLAYLLCESISRDLKPQFVGLSETTGEPNYEAIPLKGASLAAYLKGFGSLLMTVGDRRRLAIELKRVDDQPEPAQVLSIADRRRAMLG